MVRKGKKEATRITIGPEHFVVDAEIVVGEATPLVGEDAIVGVLGGKFRHGDAEGRTDLHALEDEVHAVGVLA